METVIATPADSARGRRRTSTASCAPIPEQSAHNYELPHVVGGVIGNEEQFPQIRLPAPVRNRGEKIERRVGRHGLQGLAVASNLAHAVLPGLSGWRGRRLRPIVIRPAPFT